MFEFGFGELVLVFMIGLLVLGPQRLPKVAAEIGKWVGRARRTANQLRRQLEREIELADLEEQQKAAQRLNPPPSPTPAASQGGAETSAPLDAGTSPSGVGSASPATTREISDAISAHAVPQAPSSTALPPHEAVPPAPGPVPQPQESTDKPSTS
jgi:Tat protein translocase TatB subunit